MKKEALENFIKNLPEECYLSGYVLNILSMHEDYGIRWCVANHPSTPLSTLDRLADDENKDVRFCVAQHPSMPPSALDRLADDENDHVRWCVAQNPSTPSSALNRLLKDEHDYVRHIAEKELKKRKGEERDEVHTRLPM